MVELQSIYDPTTVKLQIAHEIRNYTTSQNITKLLNVINNYDYVTLH